MWTAIASARGFDSELLHVCLHGQSQLAMVLDFGLSLHL